MSCKYLYNGEWLTEDQLRLVYQQNTQEIAPSIEEVQKGIMFQKNENAVNATLKIIDALNKSPRNTYPSNQIQGFFNDLRKYGASDVQINMLRDYIARNNIKEINKQQLIQDFMADASYTVEINTTMQGVDIYDMPTTPDDPHAAHFTINGRNYVADFATNEYWYSPEVTEYGQPQPEEKYIEREEFNKAKKEYIESLKERNKGKPSQHYSNLTVSGGTNYTENEIKTPDITPSIKGHAAFATDKGIGWFRSDDEINEEEENYKEQGFISSNANKKTRRILEIQSDLFQKGRESTDLIGANLVDYHTITNQNRRDLKFIVTDSDAILKTLQKTALGSKPIEVKEVYIGGAEDTIVIDALREDGTMFDWVVNRAPFKDYIKPSEALAKFVPHWEYKDKQDSLKNDFLQLLNKDNNWVGFFVKSIIQDSAKKGYENVLFPSGNTANKIEGQTTVEEFIADKEKYLKEITESIAKLEWSFERGSVLSQGGEYKKEGNRVFFLNYAENPGKIKEEVPEEDMMEAYMEVGRDLTNEKSQIEREIKNAREGNNKFAAIANFYETTIKNILDKRGYKPERIKDEHGNEWYSVKLSPERDLATFYFQKTQLQSSKASPKTIARVKEWLSRVGITVESLDTKRWKGVNGIAHLLRNVIEIAEGKENVALPEEAMHFAVDMIKQNNATLYRQMFNKIGQYAVYQRTRELYADSPEYKNPDGTLNIPKIKEEAMGKLLAEYYIQKEEMSTEKPEFLMQTKTWWQTLVDWIKSLIGVANFDPFEEAINTLPQGNEAGDARIKELAELIQIQDVPSYMRDSIDQAFESGQYREIVATIAEQLADKPTFAPTVKNYLGGDEALANDILSVYQQFLQIGEEESIPNEFADEMKRKLQEKIDTFKLTKVENPDATDEDDKSYYEANIEGKTKRIGRTTEYAKKRNLQNTGGKDFFANLSDKDKDYYAYKAIAGTEGHFDIERIIKSALNPDGTLKPKDSFTTNFEPATNSGIFKILSEFLLGSPKQEGFLYQFEEGTVFLVEQQILNERVSTTNDKGEKVKGRAGTIDLLVLQPTQGAAIYDWKFIGMSDTHPEYKRSKQTQHQLQLGDYKRTLKEGYGLKDVEIKAYAIPISGKYKDVTMPTKEIIPVLQAIKIGNVNMRDEERTFLLPVAPDDQSTGNPEIDRLISSLRAKYQRIYKKRVGSEEWWDKTQDLNALHDAIRNLQIAINFGPLAVDAVNFEKNIQNVVDKYSNYDAIGKTNEEMGPVLQTLADTLNSSKYYADVDKIFTSEYGLKDLSEKNAATLASLQQSASAAKTLGGKIQEIIDNIVAQKSELEGVVNILTAEKEAKAITNSVLESGAHPLKSLNLMTKMAIDARSADQIEAQNILGEFGEIYNELAVVARNMGVSPLSLIADKKEHALISRIDPQVFESLKTAKKEAADENKKAKSRKTILSFIDEKKYKKLVMDRIKEKQQVVSDRTYSQNPVKNAAEKNKKKLEIARSLDIHRPDFHGWNNGEFAGLIKKSLKEEDNYSAEYQALKENAPALKMYNFIVELNERAKEAGYLDRMQGERFLAFINATLAQRVAASSNKFKETWESIKDTFTVQEYQEHAYGKKDVETGQLDRTIPAFFTSELEDTKTSKDLLSIIPLYIKSLVHFETSKKLEDIFGAIVIMERDKGHLESEGGRVVFQGASPKVFLGNSLNVQKAQEYQDDQIYGINSQADDLVVRTVGKFSSEENKEKRALSAKKTIEVTNKWVQQLAVGLKLLVAIPNYIGAHLQSLINSGHFYRGLEYEKNHAKIIASAFGVQGDIEKGLIDLIVPLNDENFQKGMRGIAWKQSARKWLSTISFQDFMMSTNRIPDVAHELTNALTWMENTMVVDGKLVNIRQYLRQRPEYQNRYKDPSTLKETEKGFDEEVKKLKDTKALTKIATFDSNDMLIIPGFDIKNGNLAEYRAKIVEYGRNITSQLSRENKAEYRRNIIAKSFMMFKNWIVKQVQLRALDIKKNPTLDEWEYGRTRLFFKVFFTLAKGNINKMRDIIKATPRGIQLMRQLYEEKIEDYYKKTGQKLEITEEEFFDMVRKELRSEAKELAMLLAIMASTFAIRAAAPPDDEEDEHVKNKWKLFARTFHKASDELLFYYSPLSAESITRGTILPSLGLISKVERLIDHTGKEVFGDAEKAHPLKYLFNLTPVASQFQNELAPLMFPEWTKEQGIRLTEEARAFR